MTIVFEHRNDLAGWKLDTVRKGSRGDAARALYDLVAMIDRHQHIQGLTMVPARLAALIRRYVTDPTTPPAPGPPRPIRIEHLSCPAGFEHARRT